MKNSFGLTILRIAIAFLLIVTGIWGITGGGSTLFTGITSIFAGTAKLIVKIILSIAALITGTLLLAEAFSGSIPLVDKILLLFTILWLIQMVLSLINGAKGAFLSLNTSLQFLHWLANELLILAVLIMCRKKA